jgi:hypothetical protein
MCTATFSNLSVFKLWFLIKCVCNALFFLCFYHCSCSYCFYVFVQSWCVYTQVSITLTSQHVSKGRTEQKRTETLLLLLKNILCQSALRGIIGIKYSVRQQMQLNWAINISCLEMLTKELKITYLACWVIWVVLVSLFHVLTSVIIFLRFSGVSLIRHFGYCLSS